MKNWLVVWNMFYFPFHRKGMSSFPLTNSYFSRWLLHHQPENNHHQQKMTLFGGRNLRLSIDSGRVMWISAIEMGCWSKLDVMFLGWVSQPPTRNTPLTDMVYGICAGMYCTHVMKRMGDIVAFWSLTDLNWIEFVSLEIVSDSPLCTRFWVVESCLKPTR